MQRFDTSSVSRKNLQKLIHYLHVNEVEYIIDNYEELLLFDLTELSPAKQKWVNATFKSIKESRMTENQKRTIKSKLKPLVMEVLNESTNFEMQLVAVIKQMAKDNRMTPK